MPQLPELSAGLQRDLVLLVPFLFAGAAILIVRPGARMLTGAFLAVLWNFVMLMPANLIAGAMGWWTFQADRHLLLGLPVDVLLGWSVWWGAVVFLAFRGRYVLAALGIAVWVDLLAMPQLSPLVRLAPHWLLGEVLVVVTCLLPGWMLAAATARDLYVGWRSAAQALISGMLLFGLLPAVLLEQSGASLWDFLALPSWQISLALNALMLPVILGLAGNQEFADRGRGTPIPFDPPKHLVVTGPYAYVANPMQISIVLSLIGLGILYANAFLVGASAIAVIYCLGLVQWHHTIDMEPRFGEAWFEYRRHVGDWWPRWTPWVREPSTVFFARHCDICQDTENWLSRLSPIGLHIEDAAHHPGVLARVTYRFPNGSEVQGIYAIAACLNHVNFAFAFFGWFMRLPGIRHFLQIVIDGTGERAPPMPSKSGS